MEKRMFNRKGISPLIATIILVGFVVVIGVLIWVFFKGTITGNIEKVQCESMEEIALDLSASCECDTSNPKIKLNNMGQQTIEGIMTVFYYADGHGEGLGSTIIGLDPGEEKVLEMSSDECPKDAEIIPAVVKESGEENKLVVCMDKLQKVKCD